MSTSCCATETVHPMQCTLLDALIFSYLIVAILGFDLSYSCFNEIFSTTVKPDDSKPIDSKLQEVVNFLLLTKISNHSINHMIDSKHLAIVNIFALLKKFTKARFDCILKHS